MKVNAFINKFIRVAQQIALLLITHNAKLNWQKNTALAKLLQIHQT